MKISGKNLQLLRLALDHALADVRTEIGIRTVEDSAEIDVLEARRQRFADLQLDVSKAIHKECSK